MDAVYRSQAGQQFIRELLDVLDAMPINRLISDDHQRDRDGVVYGRCAVGQMMFMRRVAHEEDLGYPSSIVDTAVRENDRDLGRDESDEARWHRMRAWAKAQLD